jgi:hypothetical protein
LRHWYLAEILYFFTVWWAFVIKAELEKKTNILRLVQGQ